MPSNIERFGSTLHGQMKSVEKSGSKTVSELGKVNQSGALLPDESPGPIPKGEYSICGGLPDLKGKRVMINWCGAEAVVINIIS